MPRDENSSISRANETASSRSDMDCESTFTESFVYPQRTTLIDFMSSMSISWKSESGTPQPCIT